MYDLLQYIYAKACLQQLHNHQMDNVLLPIPLIITQKWIDCARDYCLQIMQLFPKQVLCEIQIEILAWYFTEKFFQWSY